MDDRSSTYVLVSMKAMEEIHRRYGVMEGLLSGAELLMRNGDEDQKKAASSLREIIQEFKENPIDA